MEGIKLPGNQEPLILEFGFVPSSPNYERAVHFAEKISGYTRNGEGNKLRHSVPLAEDEPEIWFNLFEIVKEWKSAQITRGPISNSPNRVQWILRCYQTRIRAEDKLSYCFKSNWIGCQRISEGKTLSLYDKVGKFIGQEKFKANKERIRDNIKEGLDEYGLCPAFEYTRINEQINKLPEIIEFKNDKKWKPRLEEDYQSGKLLFSGLEFNQPGEDLDDRQEVKDPDQIRDYVLENLDINYFEHKILVFSETEWERGANAGSIEKIAEAGLEGWQLLTVINHKEKWYCILQRERELEPGQLE